MSGSANNNVGRWTRRSMLQGVLALVAMARAASKALAQQKAPKKLVQYQEQPKGTQECDRCLQFVAPNACKLVEGPINPKGWCALYAPKPK